MSKEDLDDDYSQDWILGLALNDMEPPKDAWIRARTMILGSKQVSDEERVMLESSSLGSVTQELRNLEAKHANESRTRGFASKARIKPILDGLVNLNTAISFMASLDPHGIAPLVWGGISIVTKTAQAILKIPDALIDFLNRIGWTLSRLQLYEKLSCKSPRLNRTLMHVFVKYLGLCLYLRDSFIKDGSFRPRWKTSLKFGTEAFTGSMTKKISEIDAICTDAHQEAQLAVTSALLENIGRSQQVLDNLTEMERTRERANLKNQKLKDLQRAKRAFLKWLRHVPAAEDLHKFREEQLEGTCEWIDDDKLISSWLSSASTKSSLLWISGGPGTGKTILSAHIISELQHCHPTAYFFCKSDDQRKQITTAVLQNWIWQLVHDSPILPEPITSPSDECQSPSSLILSRTLLGLQQYLQRSYLIVDGLDECIDDLTEFLRCCQTLSERWCVLIISRDVPNIRKTLERRGFMHKALTTHDNKEDINSLIVHKAISVQDTKGDINKFVDQKTKELADMKSWHAVQKGIANVLSANAEGMFLWVRLVLDFLLEDTTLENDIEEALGSIPSDLNGFYDKILQKMKAQSSSWKIALRALLWILFAFRPLSLEELHAAIACEFNSSKRIENFEFILRGSCGLLLKIDNETKKVTMIHTTVKEYLLEASDILGIEAGSADNTHSRMGATCLTYLNNRIGTGINVDNNVHQSEQRFQTCYGSLYNCLLDYSLIYWCQHLNKSREESSQWQAALHHFFSSEELTVNWLQLFQNLHSSNRPGTQETAELLHVALRPESNEGRLRGILSHEKLDSFRNHLGLADGKRFIRWDRFLRGAGDLPTCFPIILIAAHFNFVDIIKREIRRRVPIETKSHRGGTCLLWAARGGSSNVVQYLITKNADVNDQSRVRQETALAKSISLEAHLVSYSGTYPLVEVLLEAGVDPDLKDYHDWTALNILVGSNNTDGDGEASVVSLLLDYSPDMWKINHKIVGSILRQAISCDKPGIARAIFEKIRVQSRENVAALLDERFEDDNALHFSLQKNICFVPLLLEYGANMNAPDARGVLPLQYAAQHNLESTVRAFIENGCNVDTLGRWDASPLVIALENQSMDAASVLIDMGADTENIPESLILLPRSTALDDRIQAMKPANIPWPICARDIYQVCYHFKEVFFLPIPITARILDMAELWLLSSVVRNDMQPYTDEALRTTYLRSAPILGREIRPVQKITFTITSHDQGFDSNPTYSGNWTWFESRRLPGGDSTLEQSWPSDPKITFNRHAEWEWHCHEISWPRSHDPRSWDLLKPGDRVAIIACARFPAWCNYVSNMRVDISTSILRRHYTRKEVSEIWDKEYEKYLRKSNTFEKALSNPELPVSKQASTDNSRLQILVAEFGAVDVTDLLTELIIDNKSLEIDTNLLELYLGYHWPQYIKTLSFLYQFSDENPHLLITGQKQGTVFVDSNVSGRKTSSLPKPLGAGVHILAIVYGLQEITNDDTYERVYAALINGYHLLVSNENLGEDGWHYMVKTCAVYYRRTYGPIVCCAAWEGAHLKWEL